MMYTAITLTPAEMMTAGHVGVMRQVENLGRRRAPAHGAGSHQDWQLHIEGALGEMALAKALGVYWPGKGGLRDTDVGNVDVRTRSRHNYDLILHESDPDDRRFYLVTGSNGSYRVHGSILGADGKDPQFWSDPAVGRPAYFVPKGVLTPFEPCSSLAGTGS